MKREDAIIGAEVFTDDGLLYRYRVIALPDDEGMVKVKPTKKSYGEMDEFHLDDLYLYNEEQVKEVAKLYQAKVDAAKNAFEAAFQALRECEELETEEGYTISRYDMQELDLVSLKELELTIDQNGWSSSSLWC